MSSASSALSSNRGLTSLYAAMMPPALCLPVIDVDAIAAAAYRDGLAAGAAEAANALASERTLLDAARAAFETAMVVDSTALRGVFVTLIRSLASAVIRAELRLSPIVMAQLVDAALAAVVSEAEAVIRVHPDDACHLDAAVISDPTLARGSVVIDAVQFIITDSLDARLAALIEELL